jgi:O-antigen/teichoic acid export membrane protein
MTENPIKRLFKNLFSLLSVRSFDYAYTFLVMIILARYFGLQLYGDYIFVVSLVFIYLPFINFGIHPLMVRELAVLKKEGADLFGAGLTLRLILATLALAGTAAILPFLSMSRQLALALIICLTGEICLLGVRICAEVFTALERMHFENYLGVANRGVCLILLLLIRYLDLGFLAVFAALATVNLITLAAGLIIVRRNFLRVHLVWRRQLLWFWLKEAFPIALSFMTMESFLRVDVLMLRVFRDPAEIAFFDVSYKIIYRLISILSTVAIVLSPVMARLAETDMNRLKSLLEQCLKYLFILAIPLTAAAHILGPQLIVPLFGANFKPAELSMSILSLCLFFAFLEPFLVATLISIKKTWVVPISNGIALGINLLLDLLLIPPYGFLGACYANIGAYAFMFVLSLILSHYYLGGFSLRRVTEGVLPIGLGVVALSLLYHSVALKINFPSFFLAFLVVLALLAVYVMLIFLTKVLNWEEFASFKEAIKQREG